MENVPGFEKRRFLFRGPHCKDYSICGSTFRAPDLGNLSENMEPQSGPIQAATSSRVSKALYYPKGPST